MSVKQDELRDELIAMMNARQELSSENERYLAETFLQRLDDDIDARIAAQVSAQLPRRRGVNPWMLVVVLALGAGLTGAAVPFGLGGLLLVWASIVVITYFFTRQ